jgi:hypothetical protein
MALLASKVLFVTVSFPDELSSMPPPKPPPPMPLLTAIPWASLPVSTQLLRLRAALSSSRMPPPEIARPPVMVSPEMLTLALPLTSKIRLASLPLTASLFAPGPSIVTLWLIGSWRVSVMVPCSSGAKSMVSPLPAAAMADRREPAPLSNRLVTGKVLGKFLSSSTSRRGRSERRDGVRLDPWYRDGVGEVDRRNHDANNMIQPFLRYR